MGWKDKFTFRERHYVEHDVCGAKFRFFPNRIGLLHELAEVSKTLAPALATLFSDRTADAAVTTEHISQGDAVKKTTTVQAISAEVLRARADERERAIDSLLTAVGDPRNRLLLGRLLMDSLRDDFPYSGSRSAEEVEEFLSGDGKEYGGLDGPALAAMLVGWVRANAKVFGPVGEQVAAAVKERLGGEALRSETSVPPTSPSSGSDSRTPSSTPPSVASLSTS